MCLLAIFFYSFCLTDSILGAKCFHGLKWNTGVCVCMYIYIYIYTYIYIYYIYIYTWYSYWAKVFWFHIESWPEWNSKPRPRANRAHALSLSIYIYFAYIKVKTWDFSVVLRHILVSLNWYGYLNIEARFFRTKIVKRTVKCILKKNYGLEGKS